MVRRKMYLIVPLIAIGFAGCGRQAEQKQPSEQAEKAAQPAQQAEQQKPPETQAPAAGTEPAAPAAPAPIAPAPGLKQRPSAAEPARRPETARREESARKPEPVRAVEIPAGAQLNVRLNETLDTGKNSPGDTFTATLEQPVVVDGRSVIPRGTTFKGSVTTAAASGRLAGQGTLTVKLDSFELNGKTYRIDSTTVSRVTDTHKKRDIGIIGGTSALGAAIGAIAGGGKGAAIGAGAGAAAGTAGAAATGKAHVRVPAETVMLFTLQNPVSIS